MIATDRDALLCDLAETYGIFNLRALPARLLATLAVGLRDNSRIKMSMSGDKVSRSEMLLAAMVDRLSMLVWFLSEDGQNGVNRPNSIVNIILGETEETGDVMKFETPEDFEEEWYRRTGVRHV